MASHSMRLSRRAFIGGAAAFGITSMAVPRAAFADPTSADKQAEADAVFAKLKTLQSEIEQKTNDYYTALDAHDAALAKMDECQAKIDDNNAQIADLQGKLGTRANDMYRNGQTTFLDIVLGSATFEQFAKNWDLLTKMNENDAQMVADTKALRADNEAQHAEYSKQEQEAADQLAESERVMNESKQLAEQYQASYDQLSAEAQALYDQEQQAAKAAEAAKQQEAFAESQQTQSDTPSSSTSGGVVSGGGESGNGGGGGGGGGYIPPSGSVVDYAYSQIGVPYDQANPQVAGDHFDCSGLCQWCWQQATGINIGRTTWAQYASAGWVGSLGEAQPGDVLYTDGHVGICISAGGGSYIHAPTWGQTVCVSSWSQFYCALRW